MRAIVQETYGGPEALELRDVDVPEVSEGAVLIRVRATSVQPLDWHLMRGEPLFMRIAGQGFRAPKRTTPGADVAGVVEAVGVGVTRVQPGDEVLGWCHGGGLAEYVCVPEAQVVAKPSNVSFEEAGGVAVAGTTALQGLRDQAKLQAGERVLIVGASGGVGTFAVQIAKAMGAHVTGVCSTRNLDLVRSLGADEVIDYTTHDYASLDRTWDVAMKVAGTRKFSETKRVLAPDGRHVGISGDGGGRVLGPISGLLGDLGRGMFASQKAVTFTAAETTQDMQLLADWLASGEVRTVVDRSFPLVDAAAAIAYMEQGHARGKVIVVP